MNVNSVMDAYNMNSIWNTLNPINSSSPSAVPLIDNVDSTNDNLTENILYQHTSIEHGTFKPNISSILSNNPYDLYNTIDSLSNTQNNTIDASI